MIALALAACGGAEETTDESDDNASSGGENPGARPEALPPVAVRMLEPGAEPRRALRYELTAGAHETLRTEMRMSVALSMNEAPSAPAVLPPAIVVADLEVREVSDGGDVTYAFRVRDTEVQEAEGVAPESRAQLETELSSMVGLAGDASFDQRGLLSRLDVEAPAGASPSVRGVIDNLRSTFRNMVTPLPAEPIGVGGRWQVTTKIPTPSATFDQVATFTVRSIEGDSVTADVTVEQTAPRQRIDDPSVPPGATVTLESARGSAEGSVTFSLRSLAPTAQSRVRTETVTSISSEGRQARMRMDIALEVSMRPDTAGTAP